MAPQARLPTLDAENISALACELITDDFPEVRGELSAIFPYYASFTSCRRLNQQAVLRREKDSS
jgi:hypothetical protein